MKSMCYCLNVCCSRFHCRGCHCYDAGHPKACHVSLVVPLLLFVLVYTRGLTSSSCYSNLSFVASFTPSYVCLATPLFALFLRLSSTVTMYGQAKYRDWDKVRCMTEACARPSALVRSQPSGRWSALHQAAEDCIMCLLDGLHSLLRQHNICISALHVWTA